MVAKLILSTAGLLNPAIYVVIGIIVTAAAQIFLKRSSAYEVFALKGLLYLSMSIFCYLMSFISYYLALKYFDISKISPIMMIGIVSLVAVYGFLAGESFNFIKVSGIILAIISIVLILNS